MALAVTNSYKFKSPKQLSDFVNSLINEGYPVAIQTVYNKNTCIEGVIDYYEVFVGEKGVQMKLYLDKE